MFQVDVRNLVRSKLYICRDYHIQPSEIERMPFYEYEYIIEDINQIHKEQEEQNKKQQEEYDNMKSSMNPSKMMNSAQNSFKMPSMPKMNIPKF